MLRERAGPIGLQHADVGKRVDVQRKPASDRSLADEQYRPGIVIAGGKLGKQGEPGRVIALFGNPRQEGQDKIAFADRVEKLGGAEQFDTGCTRVLGGRLQFQLAEPERARANCP